jgi:hypothetical protein
MEVDGQMHSGETKIANLVGEQLQTEGKKPELEGEGKSGE